MFVTLAVLYLKFILILLKKNLNQASNTDLSFHARIQSETDLINKKAGVKNKQRGVQNAKATLSPLEMFQNYRGKI